MKSGSIIISFIVAVVAILPTNLSQQDFRVASYAEVAAIADLGHIAQLAENNKLPRVLGAAVTNGLVGYWSMDEATGDSVVDGSANGNNGTLVGSPTRQAGKIGNGISFGDGKSINLPDKTFGNSDWTVAGWVKTSASSGWVVGRGEGSDLRIADGKVLFQLYTSSGFQNVYSTTSVNNNSWKHITATRSGNTVNIFIDGVLNKTQTISGTAEVGFNSIAARTDNSSSGFSGSIDEVYTFSRALSESEVSNLFNATSTTSPSPTPGNLISNPGFESSSSVWAKSTNGGRSVVTTNTHSGTKSQQMVASSSYEREVYQDIAVTAGAAYSAKGWIKTSGVTGPATIKLLWTNSNTPAEVISGSALLKTDTVKSVSGTSDWAQGSGSFTAPTGAVKVRVQLNIPKETDNAGTAWFDDLELVAGTTTTNPSAPIISTFSASPASIAAGQSSTLSWGVSGATTLSISGLGVVTGSSKVVSPTATTTYTLTASNSTGSTTATTIITVTGTPAPSGNFLYVSPTGSASGNGSISSPWDLQTAMNQPSSVTSGKTIYMRGGTYAGKYISNLTGATLRSYPGEWAKVDGYFSTTTSTSLPVAASGTTSTVTIAGNFMFTPSQEIYIDNEQMQVNDVVGAGQYIVVRGWGGTTPTAHGAGAKVQLVGNTILTKGSDTIYRDFEVLNSNPNRAFYNTTGYGGNARREGDGFMVQGANLKFINLVVHDNGDGLFLSEVAKNTEVYGAIVYNNGHVASDRPHGHGLYIQNDSGTKTFSDIISFNNFGLGMKAYGANQGHANNVNFKGIISFNNGTPGYYPGNPTQFPNSSRGYSNLEIGSDVYPSSNVSVSNSYLYHKPTTTVEIPGLAVGRAATGNNSGAVIKDNFVAEPSTLVSFDRWTNFSGSGNTLVSNKDGSDVAVSFKGNSSGYSWNNNTYYVNSRTLNCFGGNKAAPFQGFGLVTSTCNSFLDFNEWKQLTQLDANSTFNKTRPTGKNIFVRPNTYEPGRANIAVYNWDLSNSVSVNLSNAGLTPGQRFEVRSAENYLGSPVLSNQTYTSGMSVSLPSASRTVATPIGHSFTPSSTCPEFCAYVVVPLSAGVSQPPVPTPTPVPVPTPTPTPIPTNTPPTGSLDGARATDGVIFGWAHDVDNLNVPVQIHLYFDGPAGAGRTPVVATAGDNRSDVGNHAFNVAIPTAYRNGVAHTVYAYAIDLTDTSGASNRLLAGSPKSFTIGAVPVPTPVPTPTPNPGNCTTSCININSAQTYQTMDGWEATSQSGQDDAKTFNQYKDALYDAAVNDLGINRIRLEIRSGAENPTDWWTQFKSGQIDNATWKAKRYEIINDDANSSSVNASGFQFSEFDNLIDKIIVPMRQKMQARGEKLYINVNYVDFGSSTFEHKNNPAEYAEFVLATYQHMQSKYGFWPDYWEVVLEPDTGAASWTADQVGQVIKAAGDKLIAAGYTPRFIAPSTTNGKEILLSSFGGNNWVGKIAAISGAMQYLDTIAYHRYTSPDQTQTQSIGALGSQYGKKTAMLEWIGADYNTLHMDLKYGNNSSWQQYTLAYPGTDNGGHYYTINDTNGTFALGSRTKFFRQYFQYIRYGATRIGATASGNSYIDPLAFRNVDGKYVVVATVTGAPSPVTFGVNGLPSGTYGIFYTTGSSGNAITSQLANQTISAGNSVNVTLPTGTVGVVTVYATSSSSPIAQPTFAAPTTSAPVIQNVTLIPGVSSFKYASSPTIYFLNQNGQKEIYPEASVFSAWNANYNSVRTIPDTQTYPDGGTVRLPQGTLVKRNNSTTIYLVEGNLVRPFASLSAFTNKGYFLPNVISVNDKYLDIYTTGPTIN